MKLHSTELYIRIVKYVFVHSNWADEGDQQLPGTAVSCDPRPSHPWAASALWLEELIRRRLWLPAKIFTKIVASVVPQDIGLAIYRRLLTSLSDLTFSHPSTFIAHVAAHNAFSQYLARTKMHREAENAARLAEELLLRATLQSNHKDCFPRERIEYEFALESLTGSHVEKIQHLSRAAAIASEHDDLVSESRALSAMLDIFQTASDRSTVERISVRLDHIEGDLQPDLPSLLYEKQRLLGLTGHDNRGKLAEWFTRFEKGHPTSSVIHLTDVSEVLADSEAFDNPQALYYKASALSRIYMGLGNKPREEKARDEMDSLEAHLPHTAPAKSAVENVAWEWFGKTARVLNPETGMRVLLQRISSAWERGMLSLDELKEIVPDAGFQNKDNDKVYSPVFVDTTSLRKELFGPPLRQEVWQRKLQIIIGWLKSDTVWSAASSDLLIGALLYYRQLHHIDVEENSQPYVEDQKQSLDAFNDSWPTFDTEVKDIFRVNFLRSRLTSIQCDYHLFLHEVPAWRATPMLMSARNRALELLAECDTPQIAAQGDFVASVHLWIGKIDVLLHANMHFSSEAFSHFEEADRLHGQIRTEMSSIGGVDAQEVKKSWRETQFHNDAVLTEAVDHAKMDWFRTGNWGMKRRQDRMVENMWNWIQRSKGRAIAEAVAMSNELPKKVVTKATEKDDDHLLDSWQDLRKSIYRVVDDGLGMGEKYRKRNELEDLEKQMASVPELDEVVSLVNGKATTTTAMQSLMADLPEDERSKIVLVDWFLAGTVDGRDLHLITLRHQGPPVFQRVEKGAMQKAEAWIQKYLSRGIVDNSFENAFEDAQAAAGLVKPLAGLTKPGEILVLCPTASLHRFPLQCLKIKETTAGQDEDGQILMQRNTVAFIHSMTLLRFCIDSRIQHKPPVPGKAVVATPLERCSESVVPIAELFEQTPLLDDEVSRSNIISECAHSDFFHFCGHVHASSPDHPLDAHLLLYDSEDEEGDAVCSGAHPPESQLSGADIIEKLTFNEGAHVNLMACDSGVTYESAGDDMLGLIPSFFYAGARSVLGTLWPVAPYYAQEWTEAFARECAYAVDEANNKSTDQGIDPDGRTMGLDFVNLAKCCQEASLSLAQRGENRMQDWGAYVFHGYWGVSRFHLRRLGSRVTAESRQE